MTTRTQRWDFSVEGRPLLLLFVMMCKALLSERGSACVRHAQIGRESSKSQKTLKYIRRNLGKAAENY